MKNPKKKQKDTTSFIDGSLLTALKREVVIESVEQMPNGDWLVWLNVEIEVALPDGRIVSARQDVYMTEGKASKLPGVESAQGVTDLIAGNLEKVRQAAQRRTDKLTGDDLDSDKVS